MNHQFIDNSSLKGQSIYIPWGNHHVEYRITKIADDIVTIEYVENQKQRLPIPYHGRKDRIPLTVALFYYRPMDYRLVSEEKNTFSNPQAKI